MARQEQSRRKPRVDDDQKRLRRNQLVFAIMSGIIILSMIISLVNW